MIKKKKHPKVKLKLHPRNKHRGRYVFEDLIKSCPELAPFVRPNDYGDVSIDFFNPEAVKMLNTALLMSYYDVRSWDIPEGYLCPPIPGRADYIHHIADLLGSTAIESSEEEETKAADIRCLDIGVGANCVYPIIGTKEYNWSFVGTDIDPVAIDSAQKIVEANPRLEGKVELRLQENKQLILKGVVQKNERFDLAICNPPFHSSLGEAQRAAERKLRNLKQEQPTELIKNFGGKSNELWCLGGEEKFARDLIMESIEFANSFRWFSTLISKSANLENARKALERAGAIEVKTIPMGQGNKISRIVAWTFLSTEERKKEKTDN